MLRRFFLTAWALLACACGLSAEETLAFAPSDRILVIAPHPDDETLGLGGAMQRAKETGASVRVVYLTNGEANEVASVFYQKRPLLLRSDFIRSGLVRKQEALEAMRLLGFGPEDLVFFGYPDGGMLSIWLKYWAQARPYRSLFTRSSRVPYKDNVSYGRDYKGDEILRDLERVLMDFQPTAVYVTAPFDLNPDHQAAYLYAQVALRDLRGQLDPSPEVRLYLVHAHQWPQPKKYLPREPLGIPAHIDWHADVNWRTFPLAEPEVEKKYEAILRYKSQISYKKNFLAAFARKNEIYADYPAERIPAGPAEGGQAPFGNTAADGDVRYHVLGEELWIEIPLSSMLDEMGVLSSYLFGWREGFLFSEMPKLTFKLFGNKMFVYDGFKNFHDPDLKYRFDKDRLFIRVPLRVLKDPDLLFVSTRNAKEELSLDFGAWRMLETPRPSQ